jgi:hypothetical protein
MLTIRVEGVLTRCVDSRSTLISSFLLLVCSIARDTEISVERDSCHCHARRTFREVLVHDVEALLVNVQVFVVLQVVNSNLTNPLSVCLHYQVCIICDTHHATGLLDKDGVLVESSGTVGILVHFTDLQNVVQSVKGNL